VISDSDKEKLREQRQEEVEHLAQEFAEVDFERGWRRKSSRVHDRLEEVMEGLDKEIERRSTPMPNLSGKEGEAFRHAYLEALEQLEKAEEGETEEEDSEE
jgi:hypothetical protein